MFLFHTSAKRSGNIWKFNWSRSVCSKEQSICPKFLTFYSTVTHAATNLPRVDA